MKFLFSFEYPFHRHGYGGGHQILRGLARELARGGHEVHVCCSGDDELQIAASDAPVRFHFTGNRGRWRGLHTGMHTLRLLREICPDVVCCFTSEAVVVIPACRAARVPAVVYLAAPELPAFRANSWKLLADVRWHAELYLQFLGARASRSVLTLSRFLTQQAEQQWRIPSDRLTTVGLGIEPVFFRSASDPPGPLSDPPRLISVGRLTLEQKPFDRVAEALAKLSLPWQHWTIVGSGHDEARLRSRLTELGIEARTRLVGARTSAEISELLSRHDVVLLPSTRESFFITAYEAAAKAKIIVTNRVADIGEYFANSCSVVIAREPTAEAYQESLCRAFRDIEELQESAFETADRVARDHNWGVVARRFLAAVAPDRISW